MKTFLVAILAMVFAVNIPAEEKSKMNETNPSQIVEIQKQIELLKANKGRRHCPACASQRNVELEHCILSIERKTSIGARRCWDVASFDMGNGVVCC